MSDLTPNQIVQELDKHIIGQNDAKRAVAIALRNRWRRQQLPLDLRAEVTPKNILMIGPTGVGKTEIARRLAKLANAPFIKVEATKFTEVGYVGRDVESIIRDLVDMAVKMLREEEIAKVKDRAHEAAIERILDTLLPPPRPAMGHVAVSNTEEPEVKESSAARNAYRKKLLAGELDDREIEIDVATGSFGVEIMAPPGMEDMTSQLSGMFQSLANERKKTRKLKIKEALKQVKEEESAKLIDDDEIKSRAVESVEQNGIVFIDEIDKITQEDHRSGGVSREGVQRDLLPLIEGCTVSSRYGMIRTDHILFITSGAFHLTKPSDLIPELQGRLPIRVELKSLTVDDFVRILTEPHASLTEQYVALLNTEGFGIEFSVDAVRRLAEVAFHVNESTENIGARRLHTVMERLLDEFSFTASERSGEKVVIDAAYVDKCLSKLSQNQDLSQFIL